MKPSRRSLFGLVAGLAGVVTASKVRAAEPDRGIAADAPFVGQLRKISYAVAGVCADQLNHGIISRHNPLYVNSVHRLDGYYPSIAITHLEQWDGKRWIDMGRVS